MKNRVELAKYFNELGFKRGAEIGVATGRYSRILLDNIPGLYLIGVDPYVEYGNHSVARKTTTNIANLTKAQAVSRDYPQYSLLVTTSEQAANWVADGSLDFVFIDGLHDYESVKQDIELWTPKVRKGGIVSGHDYYKFRSGRGGIVQAVDEFVAKHKYELQTTEWDYEAERDDQQPDFWWIKE